jgi:hypothetical protein
LYTSASVKTVLDTLTVTNTSATDAEFTCYLVPGGDSPTNSNMLISARALAAGETYVCAPAIGHVLESGASIQAFSSTASSLAIRASGKQIT